MHSGPDPMYDYVDNQVKRIRAKIQEIEKSQNELVSTVGKIILNTQKSLSILQVRFMHNESLDRLAGKPLSNKFAIELATALTQITTSENPLEVANKFTEKRIDDLKQMGINGIDIPSYSHE